MEARFDKVSKLASKVTWRRSKAGKDTYVPPSVVSTLPPAPIDDAPPPMAPPDGVASGDAEPVADV